MEIRFYPPKQRDSKILAFADVAVAEGIIVKGFRVVDGEKGVFAAVPSRGFQVGGEQRFMNLVVFATPEIREQFLSELLEGYRQWREKEASQLVAGGGEDPVPF